MTSRRRFLGVTAGVTTGLTVPAGSAAYAKRSGERRGTVLASAIRPPRRFAVPLPVPPRARPARTTGGIDVYDIRQCEGSVEIVPGLRTTVWGYDGIFPGPTFTARSGRRTEVRVRNQLSVPTSLHLHGGVTPPHSDGYPTDVLVPARCGAALKAGEVTHGGMGGVHAPAVDWTVSQGHRTYTYPLVQRAATLWYHDHRMDFSAPQVWRGLAGMFLVHDREEDALPLPGGERDIPLMICDRSFEEDGSFRYPGHSPTCTGTPGVQDAYMDGVLGDVQLVNGAPWPQAEVSATRHRLRLLNASNARRYHLVLRREDGGRLPFTQIGGDGGLLAAPQHLTGIPMAPAERFDVVVDFTGCPVGSHVTLVNTLAHGRMRQVMRFRIARKEKDPSHVPARLSRYAALSPASAVATRHFDFRRSGAVWTINGRPFSTSEFLARPRLGTDERWRFTSDFHHPVHLHMAHFQVLSRGGRAPEPTDAGWKDTVDVRPYEVVEVLVRFRGYRGRYMLHCHNLEHEDMAMMANYQVV
ncbi:multicopper oxidase family protein [Streptomyces sp. NPDC004232]|uniref:multicopper oxidase family protein n=1 Tax=Streptomyces sp. NPDC004232 TaxID=3154454 RepID=UPI0033A4CAF5